ncbi:hypothetical protein AVEN_152408-1, partial [Araneus ventricosus]
KSKTKEGAHIYTFSSINSTSKEM